MTVSIYDGATLIGTATPDVNGHWTAAVTLLSTQGAQQLTAQATDGAGNVGTSTPVAYTLDTVAPSLAITSAGGLTNQTSQTISGTIDLPSGLDGVDLRRRDADRDGDAGRQRPLDRSGHPALDPGGAATDGAGDDGAGNVGTSTPVAYTLDTVAPGLAITSAGGLTNQTSQTISGTIDWADAGLTVSI